MRYLIVAAALAVAGCDEPPGAEKYIQTMDYAVRTVEVKGHEYIIFGGGYLLSERAAAGRAAAGRAAAVVWQLSAREREIVRLLGGGAA